jgi:hypothetical protein
MPLLFGILEGVLRARMAGTSINWRLALFLMALQGVEFAVLTLFQLGLCYLVARWFFKGRASFTGLLRPFLLGQIVTWLAIVPVIGSYVAGLWEVAVLMAVFRELEEIRPLAAYTISLVVGLSFFALNVGIVGMR